jgi:hypothetical protein
MVYIDGEDDDPIEFTTRLVPLDCPPEDYFGV